MGIDHGHRICGRVEVVGRLPEDTIDNASQDIVDAAPHHVELWSDMMVKLDLWKAPDPERVRNRAAASTHAVHATLPLSEVVANWDELAEALGGSVFEDMLA